MAITFFASMNKFVFYCFVAGITLFSVGLIWLMYLNAKMNYEYTNDGDTLSLYASIAAGMCMVGILTFAVSGVIAVS